MSDDEKIYQISKMRPTERLFQLVSNFGFIAAVFTAIMSLSISVYQYQISQQNLLEERLFSYNTQAIDLARNNLVTIEKDTSRSIELVDIIINNVNKLSSENLEKSKSDLLAAANELASHAKSTVLSSAIASEVLKQAYSARPDKRSEWNFNIISSALAQSSSLMVPAQASPAAWTIDGLRPTVMLAIIGAITVFFLFCIALYCMTKDTEKLKFADNMMRTIVGFYIGIVTGLLGLPGR